MAIPKFLEDLNILSKLGDYPGSDDNLSAEGFKSKFDEGPKKIQKFINEILIPELDMIVDVRALLNGILDKTLTLSDKAADAKATGDALNGKISKTGGDMTGPLNLPAPTENTHAVNKGYVDTYVDSKHITKTAVLLASGWSGSGPYTQAIAAKGITEEDHPHIGPVYASDMDTRAAQREAWALVSDADTEKNSIFFICDDEKPATDISIQIEVNR